MSTAPRGSGTHVAEAAKAAGGGQAKHIEIDVVRAALSGDYIVLEELGRGGMAIVYRAREKQLDREVALKVLPARLAFDADFVERFQNEARTACQLEHPNIVPIYRVGRHGDVIFFAMKLLRGQSLAVVLRERGKLAVNEVRHILAETAGALGFAAKRSVVHRDIKPDNIVVDHDGRCVVTDFGIAKTQSGPMTAAGTSMGTPRYMSPEHAQGTPVDGRSDIYSLGVVAYQCLTGKTPFNADDPFAILYKHINEPLPEPELATAEERELYAVIERMLAKKPEDRYQHANDLLSALGVEVTAPALAASVVPLRPKAVTPTQVMTSVFSTTDIRKYGPQGWRFWAAVGALIVLSTGGYLAFRSPRPTASAAATLSVKQTAAAVPLALPPAVVGAPQPVAVREPYSKCPAAGATKRPRPWSLLVDYVSPRKLGSKLTVNYDVCGLAKDAAYAADITVWPPKAGGLKRIFGGGGQNPVTVKANERAIGPRSRRSKLMDISALKPGPYSLSVTIAPVKGKRIEKVTREFQIVEKK